MTWWIPSTAVCAGKSSRTARALPDHPLFVIFNVYPSSPVCSPHTLTFRESLSFCRPIPGSLSSRPPILHLWPVSHRK
jgi:hypothetical protein